MSSVNVTKSQFLADLVTFTEEILNGKLHICAVRDTAQIIEILSNPCCENILEMLSFCRVSSNGQTKFKNLAVFTRRDF